MNRKNLFTVLRSLTPFPWLAGLVLITLAKPAFADHSLQDILSDNPAIAQSIEQITNYQKVVCDLENSNQVYYTRTEKGQLGTAWKQIALCFETVEDREKARQYFVEGGPLGFYSAPGIVGVLVVSYTWENFRAGRLISITYH